MYIAQAWLRGYWNWICVGTGRDWQLFQNKKVQFCCRGRFLSSARMELIFFDNMAFGSWAKMEFCFKMAFEIRFWCGGYSILTRNPILAQDPTAMLAKTKLHSGRREKKCSAAKLGGLCSEKNWIFFIQYTYMSGPNKPSIRLVLCILAVLKGRKEKNPCKQTLSLDPLP